MKRYLIAAAICLFALGLPETASASEARRLVVSPDGPYTLIADALADARNGDAIEVHAGTYAETLIVDRSVTLEGLGWPVIDGGEQGTVVDLIAPGIVFRGFEVRGSGVEPDRDHAGITVSASNILVEHNRLRDVLFGIFIAQADDSVVRDNDITSKQQYEMGRKGDGIRLWYSQNVIIEDNHVSDARDVVVWYSSDVILRRNTIENGRYGVHLMYCDRAIIENNTLQGNSVGIYSMYTDGAVFRDNMIRGQRGPSGYALAFKDANNISVTGNVLVDNRVGIFLDDTPYETAGYGRFEQNILAFNDVGVIVQASVHGNSITGNTLWENAEQVSIQGGGGSMDNLWQGNTWSDYSGFDVNGDGLGDIPYVSERLFENLMDHEPRLRALSYSPAIQAIEFAASTFPVVRPQPKLTDVEPRIEPAPLPAFAALPHDNAGRTIFASLLITTIGLISGALIWLPIPHHHTSGSQITGATGMASLEVSNSLVTAQNVAKCYGKTQALDGISFAMHAGEAVALWGPNGAGKTTLLKAVLGLIVFDGSIEVTGYNVQRKGKLARKSIGYVPQDALFYDWTLKETMAFYTRIKKADSARTPLLLDRLGLTEHSGKRVPALSGGLKQRLALAVALLSDPPVMLLDEPTANLDVRARLDYLALLEELRSEGKLILYASHRLEELDVLADRVLVLENGHLVSIVSPQELRESLAPGIEMTLWIPEEQRQAALECLTREGLSAHFNGRGTVVVHVSGTEKVQPLHVLSARDITVLDFELEQTQSWN